MSRDTSFWMVWREFGPAPTKRHFIEQDAKCEAERLAKENPGTVFYVLSAIAGVKVQQPAVWRELRSSS